ncbi:MAG: hypothetical protein QF535_15730, partial [Anaerolineales bacterium]|nr:hypothetical protein [Anaerolineales bacterium]
GIGTTAPSKTLTVDGEISASNNITLRADTPQFFIDSNTTGKAVMKFQSGGTTRALFGLSGRFEGNSSKDVMIAGDETSNIRFYTMGSATPKMVISGSNVGIGTTAPTRGLDLASNYINFGDGYGLLWGGGTTLQFVGNQSTNVFQWINSGTESMRIPQYGGLELQVPNVGSYPLETSGSISFWNENRAGIMAKISCIREASPYAPGALAFYTSANVDAPQPEGAWSEKMRIDSAGNVGIGTASPTARLHVYGSVTDNQSVFKVSGTSGSLFEISDSREGILYGVSDRSGNPVFTATADGNVGIGTATPAAILDVRRISTAASEWTATFCSDNQTLATARAHDSVLIQASDVPCLKIYEAASTPQVATLAVGDGNATLASSNTLRFYVNGSNTGDGYNGLGGTLAMHIKTDGKVGIGTAAPGAPLHVY